MRAAFAAAVTVNVDLPCGVVTTIAPVLPDAGTVTTIWTSETTAKGQATPPTLTDVVPVNPVPRIVTWQPT